MLTSWLYVQIGSSLPSRLSAAVLPKSRIFRSVALPIPGRDGEEIQLSTLCNDDEPAPYAKADVQAIEDAVNRVLDAGLRTADIAHGEEALGTVEMTDAILAQIVA